MGFFRALRQATGFTPRRSRHLGTAAAFRQPFALMFVASLLAMTVSR